MNEEFSSVGRRQRGEVALQTASEERVFGSLRTDSDQVSIRFALDLDRLETCGLQLVHDLLASSPKGYQLTRTITWLPDTSLRQQYRGWSAKERNRKVRELLLAEELEK
jgi:hypothetical protein